MQKAQLSLLACSVLIATTLTGCGSDNDYQVEDPYEQPTTPTTPPPSDPVTIEFPVQSDVPSTITVGESGSIFSSEDGLSLYFFANDEHNQSKCNGAEGDEPGSTTDTESCAGKWPPLLAGDGATPSGEFTFVTRDSGNQQWAYKGFPLYTFINDSAQGDINGDGVNGIWDLARPTPVQLSNNLFTGKGLVQTATSSNQALTKQRAEKEGFSLYTFDVDPINDAKCYEVNGDGCINTWPPLLADGGAKPEYPLSVLTLTNGEKQWAYKNKPLYFFAGDTEAGNTAGDGINNVWHLATYEPAIFRDIEAGIILSATGIIDAHLPDPDASDNLISQSVDKDQFTLYTFDNDTALKSNCETGTCAKNWPAYLANENDPDTGAFSKFAREDGLLQWSYNQQPVYFFIGDTAKHQINGDGVNGVWHIITPTQGTQIQANNNELGDSLIVNGNADSLVNDGNGNYVVTNSDRTGFQLYTFDNDTFEKSNCTSTTCKNAWPALLATDTDVAQAPFSIFQREDGLNQWALNGMPLYFFTGDTASGQQNGEAVNNAWWVARPAPIRAFENTDKGLLFIAHGNILPSVGKTAEQLQELTLYTFDDDVANSGESTCFGGCASTWPPLYAESKDQAFGDFDVIERTESDNSQTLQWAYKGLPLYFFVSDSQVGDTLGDYPTWTIARP